MSSDMSMGLSVTITGDSDSLQRAATQGETSIKGLEGVSAEALASLSSAISRLDLDFLKWTETSKGTEAQVKRTAETAKSEGAQIEGFADRVLQHNYAVARGLEAVGLSSEASAARVGGALEAIKGAMSGLNPVLLGLVAGAGGVFAAFEFLKSSAEAASKWQQNMDVLGQTIRNQGGDWAKLRDTVKEWADLQERTTTFSREDAVDALRQLTAAGTNLSDAMKIVRVAEDAAAATGHSLTDVVHGLMEAEHGRTQVLAELGIGTSAMIHKGTDLKTILDLIEKSMGGAAAQAADTYAGKVSQLSNAVESLKEDLGEKLLPYMTEFVAAVQEWVDAADQKLPQIEAAFGRVVTGAKSVYDFIEKVKPEVQVFFEVVLGTAAVKALAAVCDGFIALRAQMITSETWIAMRGAVQAAALAFGLEGGGLAGGIRVAISAFNGLKIAEAGATLGLSLFVGYIATHFQQSVDFATSAVTKLVKVWGTLAEVIGKVTGNTDLSTIGAAVLGFANDAEAGGAYTGSRVPTDAERGLPTLLDYQPGGKYYANPADTSLSVDPRVGLGHGGSVRTKSAHAHHAKNGGSVSGLHDLPDAFKGQKQAIDATDEAIKKLSHDLAGYKAAQNDLKYAVAQETKEHNELNDALYAAEVTLHSAVQAYNAYVDKVKASGVETDADKKKLAELKSAVDAAQKSYDGLKTKLDGVNASLKHHQDELDATTAKVKAAQDAQDKAIQEALKKRQEEYQKEYDKEVALIQKWSDTGVKLFNDFFDRGHNGFKKFSDDFKKMLDDMLVSLERSALTGLLERILGVNVTAPGSLALPGGGSVPGMSLSSGGGILSTLASAVGLGGMFRSGSSGPAVDANGDYLPTQGPNDIPGPAGSPASGGLGSSLFGLAAGKLGWGSHIGGPTGATLGSYLLAAGGGALLGQTVFGGRGFADVGGALGGVGGVALTTALGMTGPVGWAIDLGMALFGAGAGSLFGNHFNPANEPDITQTGAWGQANADMNGNTSASPMNANGQKFTMDAWTQQYTNGKGWNLVFEKFVQLFKGKTSSLPQGLQSAFARISQLWGGATDQPNFNHDGKDGYLDIGSGARAKWTEFWQYVQQFGPQIAQLVDQYSTSDVYTSNQGSASRSGSYTPSGSIAMLHSLPDYGAYVPAPTSSSPAPGGGSAPIEHPGPVGGGGGGPIGDPIGGGGPRGVHPVVYIQQNIRGSVVTQNEVNQQAYQAAGRYSNVATLRSMNRVGK